MGILTFLRKKEQRPEMVRYYELGGGWGNSIRFNDEAQTRVVGWKSPRPVKYDLLFAKMNSGKTGVYEFTKVEWCLDPHDMFFGDVQFLGYEGEIELPEKLEDRGYLF